MITIFVTTVVFGVASVRNPQGEVGVKSGLRSMA